MLNIFADALFLATRIGHRPEDLSRHELRRSPREFQDVEGLRLSETIRHQIR